MLPGAQGAVKARAVAFGGCRVAALAVLTFAPAFACSHHDASRGQGGPRVQGSPKTFLVKASPQSGDGKTVIVDEAIFNGVQGYVAVHSNGGGAPGPTIGVSNLLPPGISNHVKVTLKPPLSTSGTVFAVLHVEDDHNATYDFPRGDAPATLDGRVVVVPIQMTVRK